jgi:hypothetical protein
MRLGMGADIVVSHLRIFDCLAIAKELNHVGKFDDQIKKTRCFMAT